MRHEDCYWSVGKSHLTKNTAEAHPDKKAVVLDGRLRSTISETRNASLFYLVTRTNVKEDANMICAFSEIEVTAKLHIGYESSRKRSAELVLGVGKWPQVPTMTNNANINKHVRLVVCDDFELVQMTKDQKEAKLKQIAEAKAKLTKSTPSTSASSAGGKKK